MNEPTYTTEQATAILAEASAREAAAAKAAEEQRKADLKADRERAKVEAEKAEAKRQRDAFIAQLCKLRDLAQATDKLLNQILSLSHGGYPGYQTHSATLALFRTELRPLAKSLGHDIVLVGNRKFAQVVRLA